MLNSDEALPQRRKNVHLITGFFPGMVHFVRLFNPYFCSTPYHWFTDLAKRMIEDCISTRVSPAKTNDPSHDIPVYQEISTPGRSFPRT